MKNKKVAFDYLNRNKKVNKIFVTQDGSIFINENYAKGHKVEVGGTIEAFTREILKAAADQEAAEAKAKEEIKSPKTK